MNCRPAIILSFFDDVHLVTTTRSIKATWTVLGFEHEIRAGLKVDALRVAVPVGPNFRPCIAAVYKRIVCRDSTVIVQPENFSGQRRKLLRQITTRRIARSDVQFSIRSESQATSRMVLRGRNALNNNFAIDKSVRRLAITNYANELVFTVIHVGKI